jgi:hypothetical protein
MKLLFCPECKDVVSLRPGGMDSNRNCWCGASWGYYLEDDLTGILGGQAIPLGFANSSFLWALKHRYKSGPGYKFEAFVIARECNTIKREKEKE